MSATAEVPSTMATAMAPSPADAPSRAFTSPIPPTFDSPSASTSSEPVADAPVAPPPHALSLATQPGAPPLYLRSIRIEGSSSLRPSFLSRLCRPYLDESFRQHPLSALLYGRAAASTPLPGERTDLEGLLRTASGVAQSLNAFDLFGGLDVALVPVPASVSVHDEASSILSAFAPVSPPPTQDPSGGNQVDILLSLSKPRSRFFLKSSTDVGNVEGSANVQARVRNALGGAESLEGNVQVGTRTRRAWNLSLSTPLFSSPLHTLSLSTHASERDLTSFASCFEGMRGVRLALTSLFAEGRGSSELAFEVGERRLGRLTPDASLSIRRFLLPSPRSSLLHTLVYSSLDSPDLIHASQGWAGRLLSEVGGVGLDRRGFVKVEGEARTGRAFGDGWAWSTSLRAGMLRTLSGQHSAFSDRFFLGGPTSVRSVRYNGLGPSDMGDSLGGDAHWSAGASLYAPIPTRRWWPLKLHAWVNGGQLVGVDQRSSATVLQSLAPLYRQPTITSGIGLLFTQGPLRVEVNFGLPIAASRGDSVRKGVQLGIGVEFL